MTSIDERWEFQDYAFRAWRPGDTYSCVTYKGKSWVSEARELFWNIAADTINAELQRWTAEGWETLDEVGPNAIVITQEEQRDNTTQVADVFLWIMTLGIAFILQQWLNNPRRITVYKPIELRLKMRRLVPEQVAVMDNQEVTA